MGFGHEKTEMEEKKISEEWGQTEKEEKEEKEIEIEVKENSPAATSAPHASEFILTEIADSSAIDEVK